MPHVMYGSSLSLQLLLVGSLLGSGCGAGTSSSSRRSEPSVTIEPVGFADESASPRGDSIARKLVHNAKLQLIVEQLNETTAQLSELVSQFGGYVAHSTLEGVSGTRNSARWIVKVPVDGYREFLVEIQTLGELRSLTEDTEEVTVEYYDLEARLRTKQAEETRMLQLLEEDTKELQDILAVERELTRVREELEQSQGRLRVLKNQTAFATITIEMETVDEQVPVQRLPFLADIRQTWGQSIDTLVTFLRQLAILVVALAPWVVVFGVPAGATVRLLRRGRS